MSTIQCTCFVNEADGGTVSKFMVKYAQQIPKESIVEVCAIVTEPEAAVDGCTQSDVELKLSDIHVMSRYVEDQRWK
jgi:aspartyl-tRNA synthetase